AAARLGMLDVLERLVAADPTLVHARGGDGQTPLHVAATIQVAAYLLDHGAELDARDVDHESTPAQHMVRDRREVARFLVGRGCHTDLLMAAALGDLELVRSHLAADPGCIRTRVSNVYFPMQDPRAGGHIYRWTIGGSKTAHAVARELGHEEIFALLMERSPDELRLAVACELGDEQALAALLRGRPGLARTLAADDRRRLAEAAEDNEAGTVRLMLAAGWPVDARGSFGATPLHFAAWLGNTEMVREVLRHHPPVDARSDQHDGTPLDWALHGSEHSWRRGAGDYATTVELLLQAGAAPPPPGAAPQASEPVRAVLRRHAGVG
ncbi:MAG TPA: ankyrin repeat domain-containing protein, partial [Longimicrobiaceae bacterium]|nr:ankyrin repeat domain-containing protein [Longimicrobiaceae bacterium]